MIDLRDVPGYEGFYAADADGNIYRTERYGRRICRKIALRKKLGYLVAHLCKDAVRKDFHAHRAVWMAFNGPIPAGMEINHKNGLRHDNRLANLEVCTRRENNLHKFRVLGYRSQGRGLPGEANGSSKLTADDVRAIRIFNTIGLPQKTLGNLFGVSQPMIGLIVRREKWKHLPD